LTVTDIAAELGNHEPYGTSFIFRAEALRRRENIFVNPLSFLRASASLRETKRKIRSFFLDYTARFFWPGALLI
jgi:hypothetical protein